MLCKVVSGTTYTLLNSDWGLCLIFTNASNVVVTLPQPTGTIVAGVTPTGFPAGFFCETLSLGAGGITLTPATGSPQAVINLAASLACREGRSA